MLFDPRLIFREIGLGYIGVKNQLKVPFCHFRYIVLCAGIDTQFHKANRVDIDTR